METLKQVVTNICDTVERFIEPIWNGLFSRGWYFLYALLFTFLVILAIPGIIIMAKRSPKLLFAIIVLFATLVVVWAFLVIKK